MTDQGRFLFDYRPLRDKELARLVRLSSLYENATRHLLESLKKDSEKQIRSIIDVGAGTGHTTKLLAEIFPKAKVTYFDLSNELPAYFRKSIQGTNKNFRIIQGDILTHSFDETYDLVFSRFALKHMYDPAGSVQIMADITNHGGMVLLFDKDVFANIWYPCFPLYKSGFITALNKYNQGVDRGGDSGIGRKMRTLLEQNGINVRDEQILAFNLQKKSPEMEEYKKLYIQVYENLVPELVSAGLIGYPNAMNDLEYLKKFLDNEKNTAIILDFIVWGNKRA